MVTDFCALSRHYPNFQFVYPCLPYGAFLRLSRTARGCAQQSTAQAGKHTLVACAVAWSTPLTGAIAALGTIGSRIVDLAVAHASGFRIRPASIANLDSYSDIVPSETPGPMETTWADVGAGTAACSGSAIAASFSAAFRSKPHP